MSIADNEQPGSPADPFRTFDDPPPGESPAQLVKRLKERDDAQRSVAQCRLGLTLRSRSEAIDADIALTKALKLGRRALGVEDELVRQNAPKGGRVEKILLLGPSQSGKSTLSVR